MKLKIFSAAAAVVIGILIIVMIGNGGKKEKADQTDVSEAETTEWVLPLYTDAPGTEASADYSDAVWHFENESTEYNCENVRLISKSVDVPVVENYPSVNEKLRLFCSGIIKIDSFEKAEAEDGYRFSPDAYLAETTVCETAVFVHGEYISVLIKSFTTGNGAGTAVTFHSTVISLKSGNETTLSDFLGCRREDIDSYVFSVLSDLFASSDAFFPDAAEMIDGIVKAPPFYLNEQGAVLFISPGIVSPAAFGTVEIVLPYEMFG